MSNAIKKESYFGNLWRNMVRSRISYFLIAPFCLIFFTFTVLPVIQAIIYSFTDFNMINAAKWIGFENYKNLFINDPIFPIALKNTFLFAIITGPCGYMLCLTLAWFVSELSPKIRTVLTLLFYAPTLANIYYVWQLIFSGDANGFLNGWLIKLGVTNGAIQWLTTPKYIVPIVIIVVLWSSVGASFLSFIAGFQNIDSSLYDAGAVDGVKNRWQELWYITLPTMRPQLMFGAVMSITGSFGIGTVITALCGFPSTNYAAHTLMHHLEDYGNTRFQMGYACAIATLLFIMMLVINKFIQSVLQKVGE